MGGQLVYTLISEMQERAINPWLDIRLRPGNDMIVAVPSGRFAPSESRQWLTEWVKDQHGTVSSSHVQTRSRILLHTKLARYHDDEVILDLDLTELSVYDPSLQGIRLTVPRFAQVLELETTRTAIQREETLLGSILTITPLTGEGRLRAQVDLLVSWQPALLLALISVLAGIAAFLTSSVIRLRCSDQSESIVYFGQAIPTVFVAAMFLSGSVPYLVYKMGLVPGFIIPVLVSGMVIAAGAVPLMKGQYGRVRFQLGSLLALQILPMILFLFLRLSLEVGAAMPWGEVLRQPIVDWLLDPLLLFGLVTICGEISPYLMGARRLQVNELPFSLPRFIRPERLWLIPVGAEGVANAVTVGLLPRLAHVIVTDRLLTALAPVEVRAVMAHEAAHVKQQHLSKLAVWFLLLYSGLRLSTAHLEVAVPGIQRETIVILGSVCAGLLFLVTSRWIARRFEFEADRVAAQMLGTEGPTALASALVRLETVNGPKRTFELFGTHPAVEARKLALRGLVTKSSSS